MLLQKLTIYGFKSFADKTEIEFGSGVTAVIGPNGCGKSNVVDAIRWVFGEQKASALRSGNMQDVIFSGTQRRSPLNMAEVTLTMKNNKKILPIEFSEVAITRRIFRSGETQYCINKVPCRLRDIHDMFLDTGMGSSAYTTIENTMINTILSDKAEERRELFEEAAGIGKYKQRRKESLRQLEKTTQDLLRISDKIGEADRQVRMLARHVEKANRYKRYFDDLKVLEVAYENRRYTTLRTAVAEGSAILAEQTQTRELTRSKIATAETLIEKLRTDSAEKEQALEAAAKAAAESSEQIVVLDKQLSVSRERLIGMRETIGRFDRETTAIETQITENSDLKVAIEKSIIEHESTCLENSRKVASASDELARFDAGLTSSRQGANRLAQEHINVINAISEQKNILGTISSSLASTIERSERLSHEIDQVETRNQECFDAIESCRSQLSSVTEEFNNLSQARTVLLARIEKEDLAYRALVEKEKHLEAHIAGCRTQRKFLEGLDASFEGYDSGVKGVLTRNMPGLVGIAANLIKVTDDASAPLIEKALGQAIQTLVFDTDSHLFDAVKFLRENKIGTAPMVSLERLALRTKTSSQSAPQGATVLAESVQTQPEHAGLVSYLFNNIYVAATDDAAFSLSAAAIDATFISREGIICRSSGAVVAGNPVKENLGILQRRLQIEKLVADIDKSQREYETALNEKDICILNRDEAKYALVEVDEKLNRGRSLAQEQESNIRHYEQEMQGIAQRILSMQPQLSECAARSEVLRGQIATAEAALQELVAKRDEIQANASQATTDVATKEQERIALADHQKNVELSLFHLQNRITGEKQDVVRLTQLVESLIVKKQKLAEEKHQTQLTITELDQSLVSTGESIERTRSVRTEREALRDAVREEYNSILNCIEEHRQNNKADQSDLESVSNSIHQLELKKSQSEQEMRNIRERVWNGYEVDLETPPENMPMLDQEDAAAIDNIAMLKERIKRVGQVNMAALEDYEIENKRLTDLTAQRDDLQKAVDELQQAIKKLDREARQQFITTFEQVKVNFTQMFTTLFEGGEAHLSLDETVDPLEAPIHINVRPTGKKMRGVQLLSGGERALTAISLLFALYLVKPSAYCILDELDAPLDDANVYRFTKLLRAFAERTQFIVITHNKRTMEAADLLYGVTQQESGVSTIVSVKFTEEAAAQAA